MTQMLVTTEDALILQILAMDPKVLNKILPHKLTAKRISGGMNTNVTYWGEIVKAHCEQRCQQVFIQ